MKQSDRCILGLSFLESRVSAMVLGSDGLFGNWSQGKMSEGMKKLVPKNAIKWCVILLLRQGRETVLSTSKAWDFQLFCILANIVFFFWKILLFQWVVVLFHGLNLHFPWQWCWTYFYLPLCHLYFCEVSVQFLACLKLDLLNSNHNTEL